MEDNLICFQLEDNLNILVKGRWFYFFLQMEPNIHFFFNVRWPHFILLLENDLNFSQVKDDLNIIVNGR